MRNDIHCFSKIPVVLAPLDPTVNRLFCSPQSKDQLTSRNPEAIACYRNHDKAETYKEIHMDYLYSTKITKRECSQAVTKKIPLSIWPKIEPAYPLISILFQPKPKKGNIMTAKQDKVV